MVSNIPLGKCASLIGESTTDAINSNFDNFESALYMKSVSMPVSCQKKEKKKFYNERIHTTMHQSGYIFIKMTSLFGHDLFKGSDGCNGRTRY